jgi:methylated-DNA-[protein]-cysteine S-methyltransferase
VTVEWAAVYDAPVGRLGIAVEADGLARIERVPTAAQPSPTSALAAEVVAQLQAWFASPRDTVFDLPLSPAPTRFQARLRSALMALAPGELVTYGELARVVGSSPRAVGAACAANPIPIVVPCHRVVAAGGLGGYGGTATEGVELAFKRRLIDLECGERAASMAD